MKKVSLQNGFPNLAMAGKICDEIFTSVQQTSFLSCPAVLFEVFHVPQNT